MTTTATCTTKMVSATLAMEWMSMWKEAKFAWAAWKGVWNAPMALCAPDAMKQPITSLIN